MFFITIKHTTYKSPRTAQGFEKQQIARQLANQARISYMLLYLRTTSLYVTEAECATVAIVTHCYRTPNRGRPYIGHFPST